MKCLGKTYTVLPSGEIQCHLCPISCRIEPGNAGRCRVRENRDGTFLLSNFGKIVCARIDTLRSRPLYHFRPTEDQTSLTIGLSGCNNTCPFCQNYEITQQNIYENNCILKSPTDIVEMAIVRGIKNISFSFSEPIVWIEYLIECSEASRKLSKEIKIIMKTAGNVSKDMSNLITDNVDAINLDIKPMKKEYLKKCGINDNSNIEFLLGDSYRKIHTEVSHIIIEGVNDDKGSILDFGNRVIELTDEDIPVHLLRHYPSWKSRYGTTSEATMESCRKILKNLGLRRVYVDKIL